MVITGDMVETMDQHDVQIVGGLFDNLLQGLLGSFKPNLRDVDKGLMKTGIGNVVDSFKPAIKSPLAGMLLDAVKAALQGVVDSWNTPGPLVVGAKKRRTRKEVEDAIIAEGGDPTQFAPWVLLLIQLLPSALSMIQFIRDWLANHKQPA